MDFSLDDHVRKLFAEEFDKRHQGQRNLVPVEKFCEETNLHRTTIRKKELEGTVKGIHRVGDKVFIDPEEFWDSVKKRGVASPLIPTTRRS